MIFRARWAENGFEAGPESLEVRQFSWDEIPWNEIAFPSVRWALHTWYDTRGCILPAAVLNPSEDERGILPFPGSPHG